MKRLVLCADDYALAPGVSQAIRGLIEAGRLSATSVMTVGADFPQGAAALAEIADRRRVSLGLHLVLTGGFNPAGEEGFRPMALGDLVRVSLVGRLDRAAIRAEIRAQFIRFREAFGRPPDHVDGHQHVHLLPGIRAELLDAAADFAPRAWIRSCASKDPPTSLKAAALTLASTGLASAAARRGLRVNQDFRGVRAFTPEEDTEALFRRAILSARDGAILMCHPGWIDDVLIAADPVTTPRQREAHYLASPAFLALLHSAGATLAPSPAG